MKLACHKHLVILGFLVCKIALLQAAEEQTIYDPQKTEDLKQCLNEHIRSPSFRNQYEKKSEFIYNIKELIKQGADPAAPCHNGSQSLHFAAELGCVDLIEFLLARKAFVNAANNNRKTPLMFAAIGGHLQAIKILVSHGADLRSLSWQSWTPLMHAADSGNTEVIALLAELGANIDGEPARGKAPIMLAALKGHKGIVLQLIELGADVKMLDAKDFFGRKGELGGEIKRLIDSYRPKEGLLTKENALHRAVRTSFNSALSALLKIHAQTESQNPLINGQDEQGQTPLDIALVTRNTEAILLLLEHDADPFAGRFDGLLLASLVPQFKEGDKPYIFDKISDASGKRYRAVLHTIDLFKLLPEEIIEYIISLMLFSHLQIVAGKWVLPHAASLVSH